VRALKFGERLANDQARSPEKEQRDSHTHNEIRQKRFEPGDQGGCYENRDVRDEVVARAKPRGAEVDVVCSMSPEKKEAECVRDESDGADRRHRRSHWENTSPEPEEGLGENALLSAIDGPTIDDFVANFEGFRRPRRIGGQSPSEVIVDSVLSYA